MGCAGSKNEAKDNKPKKAEEGEAPAAEEVSNRIKFPPLNRGDSSRFTFRQKIKLAERV